MQIFSVMDSNNTLSDVLRVRRGQTIFNYICIIDLVISTDLDLSSIYVMEKEVNGVKMQSHIGLQLKYFEGKKGFSWS